MSSISAAAGKADLRPPPGGRLAGFASRLQPSIGTHDQLFARVLLLDDGATRFVWIACDLLGFSTAHDAELRQRIGQRLAIPAHHVWISCSHTHSGPISMPFRGAFGQMDQPWFASVKDTIADLAESLVAQLRPTHAVWAQTTVPNLAYNRQNSADPIDERLLSVQFRDHQNKPIATIINYAMHPVVLGETNLQYSADFVGYAADCIEQTSGGTALFVQGSCGDVDPTIYRDQGRHAGSFDVVESLGKTIAQAALQSLSAAKAIGEGGIKLASQKIQIPLDPPPSRDELESLTADWTHQLPHSADTPSTPEASWAVFQLAWANELLQAMVNHAVPKTIAATIGVVRIGEICAVAFPFEIYSQIGLEARRKLHPKPLIIAAYTNGLIGYAPTDAAKNQGGYGPASSHRFFPELLTAVGYGADELLIRSAVEMTRHLDNSDQHAEQK